MSQPWTHTAGAAAFPRVDEHYVEPHWCSERLFEEERFVGGIYDPACGFGRIVQSALKRNLNAIGNDIVDRGFNAATAPADFFEHTRVHNNIVSNPPFDKIEEFTLHALNRTTHKVAMIMPTARLNAARWLTNTPLRRIWLLTPRPSMPPGHVITAKGKVGGGKSDYAWLVFEHGYDGEPELHWMHRNKP
jgi:hypothetical protein